MNCLVVAATPLEIKPFLDSYRAAPDRWGKLQVDVLITGIGLTASAYTYTRHLQVRKPGFAIQAGIAGCFDTSVTLGTVFNVTKDCIADQGVLEAGQWQDLFGLGLVKQQQPPYQNKWLQNKTVPAGLCKLKKVTGISVNQITASRQQARRIQDYYQPMVESMEGASFHYVSLMEKIPFLQLRAVSNYIGERNKKKWEIGKAVMQLNIELMKLLDKL